MTVNDENVAPQENILDAKPKDPVPPRPWTLTEMVEASDKTLLDVRVTDANGSEIIGCGMLSADNREAVRWMDHAVESVNICHAAREKEKKDTAPQAYGVNDIKRLFAGGKQ